MKTRSLSILLGSMALVALAAGCGRREPQPAPASAPAVARATNIFAVIREGDTTAFVHWIDQSPDLNQQDDQGATPLIQAVKHNRLACAIDLVGNGADIKIVDHDGFTALHRAAALGYTPLVTLLIEAGADIAALNRDGLTAYDLAVMANHTGASAALEEARASFALPEISANTQAVVTVEEEVPPAVLLSTDFRTWTSASGDQMKAAFIQNIFDTVVLQNPSGEFFRIPITRLSASDQVLVRQLSGMDPHLLARARVARIGAPAKKASKESLGARTRGEDGWTVLENCRLLKNSANDGDSFHVEHEGKEYIFRLYYVDSAETENTYPERVRDQAEYFNLSPDDTIELGEAAARFTTSVLAGDRFTVATRWEDARGNSSLPRYYALVMTSQGDLDELLVEEGLVRRYGMSIPGSLGQKKQSRLKQLESKAKSEHNGAWGKKS